VIQVPINSPHDRQKTLAESDIGRFLDITILAVQRRDGSQVGADVNLELQAGDQAVRAGQAAAAGSWCARHRRWSSAPELRRPWPPSPPPASNSPKCGCSGRCRSLVGKTLVEGERARPF
jgi:hypothetical protein